MRWYIVTGVDMKDEWPELATLPGLTKTETHYCIRWNGHRGSEGEYSVLVYPAVILHSHHLTDHFRFCLLGMLMAFV